MRKEVVALVLLVFAFGVFVGTDLAAARAQSYTRTTGCTAKGGMLVAGVCIDRKVIIR